MTVLFEPAEAIAAGLCLTARTIADGRTSRHPRPCGWCEYTPAELQSMVDGFNAWAGYDDRKRSYTRHECRVWQDLKASAQQDAVLVAQAFPAPPAPPPAPSPAAVAVVSSKTTSTDEEEPSWLR